MIEVRPKLFVGSQDDYEAMKHDCDDWFIVHACKEPYHREALGYTGRAAHKDDPEYLVARRGNRLILNLIDVADPRFVSKDVIGPALDFIWRHHFGENNKVLIHCNQGRSRSPSIAMMYLASELPKNFEEAQQAFLAMYPDYAPSEGMRLFAQEHWANLHGGEF
jgi:predicted protein tyrosine phosphatase